MTCLRPSTNFSLPRNHQVKHNFEPKPHSQAISVNSFIVVIFYLMLFYFIYYYFVRIQARRGYFQPANAPTRDWGDRLEVCCCVRGQEPASPACCRSCGLLGQPSRNHWKNQDPACGWRYSEWASRLDLKEEEIGKGWNYAPPVEAMLEAAFNSLPWCLSFLSSLCLIAHCEHVFDHFLHPGVDGLLEHGECVSKHGRGHQVSVESYLDTNRI